jgi:melanoma-associated antigen p97
MVKHFLEKKVKVKNDFSLGPSANTYYSVAVVRTGSRINLNNLQGARSCHSSVGSSSGWNQPISQLLRDHRLNIIDCNNHVKSAALLFGSMCAPDALNRQFNPTGENPQSVCDLCQGTTGNTFCTNQDPYAGNIGALMCLYNRGDIAFVRHTALIELQTRDPAFPIDQFQLLCTNGQRASWQQFQQCNWVNLQISISFYLCFIKRVLHQHQQLLFHIVVLNNYEIFIEKF